MRDGRNEGTEGEKGRKAGGKKRDRDGRKQGTGKDRMQRNRGGLKEEEEKLDENRMQRKRDLRDKVSYRDRKTTLKDSDNETDIQRQRDRKTDEDSARHVDKDIKESQKSQSDRQT